MSYEPKTDKTRWVRDQVLQALRASAPDPLNTTQLVRAIGVRSSATLQATMLSMEKHGEIERTGGGSASLYVWWLGPEAPAAVDMSEFAEMLRSGDDE